jgi:hypothetical protein
METLRREHDHLDLDDMILETVVDWARCARKPEDIYRHLKERFPVNTPVALVRVLINTLIAFQESPGAWLMDLYPPEEMERRRKL